MVDRQNAPKGSRKVRAGTGARTDGYVVVLRAVNLGGKTQVDLRALVAAFERRGYGPVRSILNSGNIVLKGPARPEATLEGELAGAASSVVGRTVSLFVRDRAALDALVAANPFGREALEDPAHLTVAFLRSEPTLASCQRLVASVGGPEVVRPWGRHVFVYYPEGIGRSPLTTKRLEAGLGSESTSRNWRTIVRLRDALTALDD